MSSLNQNVIRHKIGLLNLATELGNVSKACKVMGLSRDTFYRYQNAFAEGGVEALFDSNRRKPNPKNRVEEATESAVLAYATEQPAHGQVRTSNELRQRGICDTRHIGCNSRQDADERRLRVREPPKSALLAIDRFGRGTSVGHPAAFRFKRPSE